MRVLYMCAVMSFSVVWNWWS